MAQWMNLQRIKKFVNGAQLYITCEKSGGLHLEEPGFTAGRLAGRPTKFGQGLKFLKLAVDQNIRFSARLKSIMLQNFPIILSGTSFLFHLLFQIYSDTILIFPKLCLQHTPY